MAFQVIYDIYLDDKYRTKLPKSVLFETNSVDDFYKQLDQHLLEHPEITEFEINPL